MSRQCSWSVCLPFFAIRITYANVYNVNVQNRIRRRCYGLKILLTIPCNHLRLNFLKFINFPWTSQRLFQRYPETQITRVPQQVVRSTSRPSKLFKTWARTLSSYKLRPATRIQSVDQRLDLGCLPAGTRNDTGIILQTSKIRSWD